MAAAGEAEVIAAQALARPSSGPGWAGSAEVDGALAEAGFPVEVGVAEAVSAEAVVSAASAEEAPVVAARAEAGNLQNRALKHGWL